MPGVIITKVMGASTPRVGILLLSVYQLNPSQWLLLMFKTNPPGNDGSKPRKAHGRYSWVSISLGCTSVDSSKHRWKRIQKNMSLLNTYSLLFPCDYSLNSAE